MRITHEIKLGSKANEIEAFIFFNGILYKLKKTQEKGG